MRDLCCQLAWFYLVHIAPHPSLSRLDRAHERMLGSMIVLSCVPVRRGVAASNMAAFQAHSQMNPAVTRLNAILTKAHCRFCDLDCVQVRTRGRHLFLQVQIEAGFDILLPLRLAVLWRFPAADYGRRRLTSRKTIRGAPEIPRLQPQGTIAPTRAIRTKAESLDPG